MNRLKSDNQKLKSIFIIAIILLTLGVLSYFNLVGKSRLVWTSFLLMSSFLYIAIGLLTKSKYYLDGDSVVCSDLLGLVPKRIRLIDIERFNVIDKPFPATSYLNNILWLFLQDKRFKRIKQIKIQLRNQKKERIDGHFLTEDAFIDLVKRIKKAKANSQ